MNNVIAAVKDSAGLNAAVKSNISTVFYLTPNINTMAEVVYSVHNAGKKIYIHMDMAEGLGKDKFGMMFAAELKVDGIISTRANIIKTAKSIGLSTVQRFFLIDAHSLETTIETAKNVKPDMIEIMPGVVPKLIEKLKDRITIPIIAGGLIETKEEVAAALDHGASAISTSKEKLWG